MKTILSKGLTSAALTTILAITTFAVPAEASPAITSDPPTNGLSDSEQARIIGENGARMGQGMHRLDVSGDAQKPIPDGQLNDSLSSRKVSPDLASPTAGNWKPAGIQGMDVSSWQGNVDWNNAWAQGSKFAYVKATEGTGYKSPNFNQQYSGSHNVGMIRGAYHFALPSVSSAVDQANYFVNNGGGWSADGRTLPPLLDVEYNPYASLGNTCYNMSQTQMVNWIKSFSNQVKARTGRVPMIYTTTDWWSQCTGNSSAFGENPLHIASYNQVGAGRLPASWNVYSVWQYSDSGPFVGDSNVWNGTAAGLTAFARGAAVAPSPAPKGPFTDVPTNMQFAKEITWLKNSKVTTGYSDGTYRPMDSVSREAMAAFLYRIKGSPAYSPPAKSKFKDIGKSGFYKEINWLASKGVTTGWNGDTYAPLQSINRDAMAAFLYRLAGSPAYNAPRTSPFKDVSTNNQYYKEISWLNSTGISTGWSDGTFRPYEPIKRDAMAAFLYRYDAKF